MIVAFSGAAAEELDEAISWYERRRGGLGKRLITAVRLSVRELGEHPDIGTARAEARQLPIPGFPYVIVYEVHDEQVVILALAHTRRLPGYWRER